MIAEINKSHRILCVCMGGNVRSVSLATILKLVFRKDALSCGLESNDSETLTILIRWADLVIVLDSSVYDKLSRYYSNCTLIDVGEDKWHYPRHPELVEILRQKLGLDEYEVKTIGNFGKLYKRPQ